MLGIWQAQVRKDIAGLASTSIPPSQRELAAERGLAEHFVHVRLLRTGAVDERDPALWIPRARAWASARLRERLAEPYATILAGAMWGERGALPPDLHAEFQDTGTMHVLVTAGLHLGVVAALAAAILPGRLPSPPRPLSLDTNMTVARVQESFAPPDTLSFWARPVSSRCSNIRGFRRSATGCSSRLCSHCRCWPGP